MKERNFSTIEGNEAAAYIAYRCNEVCEIYPITQSSFSYTHLTLPTINYVLLQMVTD